MGEGGGEKELGGRGGEELGGGRGRERGEGGVKGGEKMTVARSSAPRVDLQPARDRVERDGEQENDARSRCRSCPFVYPAVLSPFETVAITSEPRSAPRTSPRPPNRLTPPITAAAIASSSSVPPPKSSATELMYAASMMPPIAAVALEIMKTSTRIRATLMPRAAPPRRSRRPRRRDARRSSAWRGTSGRRGRRR